MFLFFRWWMLKVQKQCKGDALWVCASILTFDEHFRMLIMYQVVFVFSGFLTKYHRLGNLTEINFLTFSEGWKSEIRVLAFCGKDFLPDLGMAAFKLSGVPSYNILIPLWCFPHQWPHLNLISSPKSLFKYHHTVQAMGGGGHNSVLSTGATPVTKDTRINKTQVFPLAGKTDLKRKNHNAMWRVLYLSKIQTL